MYPRLASKVSRISTLIALVLVVVATLLSVTCSHAADAPAKTGSGRAVRAGIFNFKPLVIFDQKSPPTGFIVDILNHIAKQEEWNVEYVPGTWQESLERLRTDKIDIILCIGYSAERDVFLDFPKEHVLLDWGLVYRKKGSSINTIMDMEGKTIAAMKASIYTAGFKATLEQFNIKATIVEKTEVKDVFGALESGEVDVAISSTIAGLSFESSQKVDRSPVVFTPVKLGYAVNSGKNADLTAAIDKRLSELKSDRNSYYYKKLDEWVTDRRHTIPKEVFWIIGGIASALLVLVVFVIILRWQVKVKTDGLKTEIRQRTLAEESLHTITLRQSAILTSVPDIIMEVDANKVYTWANSAGLEFFGDDVVGKEASFYFVGEQNTYKTVQPLFNKSQDLICVESLQRRKDGAARLLAWWSKALVNEQGVLTGTLSTARDITDNKAVELESNRYLQLLNKTGDLALIGGWELTIATMELFWTEQVYKLHEVTPDTKVTVENAIGFYTPESKPIIEDAVKGAIEFGTPFDLELQIITAMSNLVWIRAQGEADYNNGEKVYKIIGTFQDITKQKQVEVELVANTEDLRESQSIAHVGSWRLDLASNLVVWSEELYKMYGFDPKLPPPPYTEHQKLFTTESWERLAAALQNTISNGTPYDLELETVRTDGSSGWMWVYGMSTLDSSGVTVGLRGMAQDITERKQVEEVQSYLLQLSSLNTDEDFFESLARYLATILGMDYVCIDTLHGDCLSARTLAIYNDGRFEDNVEYTLKDTPCGDVVGKEVCVFPRRVCSLFPQDAALQDLQAESYVGTTLWSFDMKPIGLIAVIGRKELNSSYFAETVLKLVSIRAANELERRQAEAEKHALEQQFQQTQKLESLGVLSGGIAHDFNNILAIIKGNCSLATMDAENAGDYINEIDKASDRAAALCRQMLAYAGKAQLSMAQVNMWMLVDEMITMLKSTLPQNAVIIPDIQTNIPFITADASQIRQIVMNLIINASEAIGNEQGEVKVSLTTTTVIAGQTEKDYHGTAIPQGVYVCLEVTDTGCGMDEETKWRIFEPFYTTKFTGRGLGMSAVLGIINSHKGALQLFSQLGQGTTFKVYLPAQTSNSAGEEDQNQSVTSVQWQGSGTILLVEDEKQLRFLAKSMLEMFGFTVLEAANGREALEMYQKNAEEVTLVMTEMGMPVMDGYALIPALKQFNPKLPIIVSSGFGDADVSSRIGSDNIAGIISKPYNPSQLREILKRVIEDEVTVVE